MKEYWQIKEQTFVAKSSRTLRLICTNLCPSVCSPVLSLGRSLALNVELSKLFFTFVWPNATVYFHLLICVSLSICHPHSVFPSLSISLSFTPPPPHWLTLCASLYSSFPSSIPPHLLPLPQKNEGDLFHRLWHVMNEILDLRRQVLVGHLTHDRMRDVKQHITARLDWGNEWVEEGQRAGGPLFSNVQLWLEGHMFV